MQQEWEALFGFVSLAIALAILYAIAIGAVLRGINRKLRRFKERDRLMVEQLLSLQAEVKTLVETLKGQQVDPAKLAQAVANETANRDALAALITPPAPPAPQA